MKTILIFTRINLETIDAHCIVTVEHDERVDPMDAIEISLSNWVKNTEVGKKEWELSSEDFNIGDLANSPMYTYISYLNDQGISGIEFEMKNAQFIPYDRILIDTVDDDH